jgi:hypothetical protein
MKTFLLALAMIGYFRFTHLPSAKSLRSRTPGQTYCVDLDRTNVNASNNVDLWVLIVSDQVLTVSTTADFVGPTFNLIGQTFTTGPSTAAFVGSFLTQTIPLRRFKGQCGSIAQPAMLLA